MDPSSCSSQSVTIDVDEKSNDAPSHKPSVKSYATKVFQESTVGILSSVFTTHSKYRRFFKVFLSSLCIAGFIYHCVTFLNHVLGYPEVVDISLDRSETYNWPAYTYCSNNPVRRSVFCKTYPKYCEMPSEYFCQKHFSYCGIYPNPIPKKKYYNILPHEITADWILKFGSVPNVLYLGYIRTSQKKHSYYEIDNISGPYLRSFGHARMLYSCYIIRSPIESSQQPLQKIRSKIEFVDENLRFFVNETEMMDPRSTPGVYFSVHSPFEVANPIKKGIFLKGGRRYELYVKMQEEVLLKAPFESDCMDYEEISEKNNGTGPRTKKMCQEKCYFDYSMLTHGCAVYSSLYPHKENICIKHIPTFEPTPSPVSKKGNFSLYKCFENCRDECRSLTYTTEIFENDQIGYVEDDEQYRRINLNIYLSNDGVKLIRHSPKYETVDVISSIGGFMGCWLGIALMDILDVFGSITTVCRYAFRKKLTKKIKRRQSM